MPLKPQVVVAAFGRRLPQNAMLATDSGQNTELAARHIDLGEGQDFAVSGALASMACGLPYAIAAGIAFPGRPVFAVVGDGGFAMQLGEFSTAVRYRIPLKVLVIKNNMLNQIAWEQMMFLGNPQFGCELQPIDFAKAAEAMGGRGFTIREPAEVEAVLDARLRRRGSGRHRGSRRCVRADDAAEDAGRLRRQLPQGAAGDARPRADRGQHRGGAGEDDDGDFFVGRRSRCSRSPRPSINSHSRGVRARPETS